MSNKWAWLLVALIFAHFGGVVTWGAARTQIAVVATGSRIVPHENSYNFTVPGYVNTNCYGTGSWTYSSVSCSSVVAPPTDIPINVSWVEVYNEVVTEGTVYTIKCTAHWIGSACGPLRKGDSFLAEVEGNTMWISARRGGNMGKSVRPKFKVLDVRAATEASAEVRPQAAARTTATTPSLQTSSVAISFRTPDGWMRKDTTDMILLSPVANSDTVGVAVFKALHADSDAGTMLEALLNRSTKNEGAVFVSQSLVSQNTTPSGYDVRFIAASVSAAGAQSARWYVTVGSGKDFVYIVAVGRDRDILEQHAAEIANLIQSLQITP